MNKNLKMDYFVEVGVGVGVGYEEIIYENARAHFELMYLISVGDSSPPASALLHSAKKLINEFSGL